MALFETKKTKQLRARIAELEVLLTPEMQDLMELQKRIASEKAVLNDLQTQCSKAQAEQASIIAKAQASLSSIQQQTKYAQAELIETNEAVLMQSFGLYTPRYQFCDSAAYKSALDKIREQQKLMIKNDTAVVGNTKWTVSGSEAKGRKAVKDMQKLLLRAFNCECDDVIEHIKFNNIDASEKRIRKSCEAISKLGAIFDISITNGYLKLKLEEMHLAHEFQIEKQKEKDRLKELRAEERERAKLEKEIEAQRKKLEKEASHYHNALEQVLQQIANADPASLEALEQKKAELEAKIADTDAARAQVDFRAANQRAGYVYIISNIGAFGEGVYKIGMTRRLDPMDRIDELGDASVPFDFDVHALIFSEDAPALETALHHAFESRKLNMINTRREFFRVSLDEIKSVVNKHFDKTVEFIDVPPAEQYRQSQLMK